MGKAIKAACLVHILLYFASIGAGPVRPSSPSCAIHFEAGSVYHYGYVTDVSINEANDQNFNGAHRPVGYSLSSDLKLSVVWKKSYDYLMKLEVTRSKLTSVSREGVTADFKELRRYPVYFHWHGDGTVDRVYLPMNEATVSANIKKGIISMLQLQTVAGHRTEVDASGECKVEYSVIGNRVSKEKTNCKNLEKSGQYHQVNKMLDSKRLSHTITTYEFANDVIQFADSEDNQVVVLNADKSVDLQAKSKQVLKLLKTTHGAPTVSVGTLDEVVEAVDSGLELIGMLLGTDVDSPTCLIDCVSLSDAVSDLKADLVANKMAKIESPKAFHKLLSIFRQTSKEKIKEVLQKNTDIFEQLLDLTAAAQTDSSIEAALEVLDFKSSSKYQKAERFVMATSFTTHPRESLLKALFNLHQSSLPSAELSESVALALGAVTRTFCQFEEQCSLPIVKDIEKLFIKTLKETQDPVIQLRIVRAMRNARLQGTKSALIGIAETAKESAISTAAIQALAVINKDFSSTNVLEAMQRIYHQNKRSYDSATRTAALSIILSTKPSVIEIRNIVLSTINQTDNHLATYVLDTLQDLAASKKSFGEKLDAALIDERLKNYNTWSPGGKANALTSYLGRSEFTDVAYQLFMQNAKTGIMKKSGMQVNLESAEHSQPMLLFSIYAQGLESFVDSNAVPEGSEPEEATAGLSLDLLDVLLRPVQFFKGTGELMSAVWNAPSEPVSALAMNILTQDKRETVYLQNGIVLDHHLLGVASIELSGFISISLWNQDAHSVIKNSGATVMTGGLAIANNNYMSANVNFELEAAAFVDFSTDVNFYVTPPQVCLRMALNPFDISENWMKTEQAKGMSKKAIYKLKRKSSVPGSSYLLSKENSKQCTKLLEK